MATLDDSRYAVGMKIHVTEKSVKALTLTEQDPRQQLYWDATMPGFGVKVTRAKDGAVSRSFIVESRVNGKKRQVVIGKHPLLKVIAAREKAMVKLTAMSQGEDPRDKKRAPITFGTLADAFVEDYAKEKKKTWDQDKRALHLYAADWWDTPLVDITPPVVARKHASIEKRGGYAANRFIALLRKMWNWGNLYMEGFDHANPVAAGINRAPEKSRHTLIQHAQFKTFWKCLNDADVVANDNIRALILFLLFSGARPEQAMQMRWNEIDPELNAWVGGTKTVEQVIPLTTYLTTALTLPRRREGNPYCFPGNRGGRHIVNPHKPWGALREAAGLKGVWMRDLRRTFATSMEELGYSRPEIKAVLNHADGDVTARYTRMAVERRRRAMQETGDYIVRLVQGEMPDWLNV